MSTEDHANSSRWLFAAALGSLVLVLAGGIQGSVAQQQPDRIPSQASGGAWRVSAQPVIRAGDLRPAGLWNDPCVLKEGGLYVMYMTTSIEEPFSPPIVPFRAVSTDGNTWQLSPQTPLVRPQGDGFVSIETPSVVKFKNTYHMYFTGVYDRPNPAPMAIGHAQSTDGVNWTLTKGPVLAATGNITDWNGYLVGEPGAIVQGDRIFVYFSAVGARPGGRPPQLQSIGVAVTDDGVHFSSPTRVVEQSTPYTPDKGFVGYSTPAPFELNKRVHLVYSVALYQQGADPEWQQVALHHAVASGDGLSDFVPDRDPILTRSDLSWTSGEVLAPAILVDGDQIKMWFAGHVQRSALGPLIRRGFAGPEFGIGLATRNAADLK